MDEIYFKQFLSMDKEAEQRLNDEENKALLAGAFALGSYGRPSVRAVQKKAASFVRDRLELDEIYAQLAEGAAELAHAALKMRRVINRKNPTPVDADDAFESVVEEASDVIAVLDTLHIARDECRIAQKLTRWEERIKDGDKELHDGD